MDDGRGEVDVAHSLAPLARVRNLHATAVADDSLVLHAFVLAAEAFPVALGAEYSFAEEAVLFRAVGAVVDGLGLFHFAVRPAPNLFGRGEGNCYCVVVVDAFVEISHYSLTPISPVLVGK